MNKLSGNLVACGRFLKPFGVSGELKFEPYLPADVEPENVTSGVIVSPSGDNPSDVKISSARRAQKGWVVHLEGINSREEAARVTHSELWIDRSLVSSLEEGEYFYDDIMGCALFDEQDVKLGVIKNVLQTGANDIWEVELENGEEAMIPVVKDVVRTMDIEGRKIVIRPIDGLF